MADKTSRDGNGPTPENKSARPHATLDLKATEIKVSKISEGKQGSGSAEPGSTDVPRPAAAATYGTAKRGDSPSAAGQGGTADASSSTAKAPSAAATETTGGEKVIVKKRGGFFSHLAASLVGGLLVLTGTGVAERHFNIDVPFVAPTPLESDSAAGAQAEMATRLDAVEARLADATAAINTATGDATAAVDAARISALEEAVTAIPALAEAQTKLAADTKAALASVSSDAGAPELITRLASVEEKLNAIEQVGATDPNASRVAQVAALTGKVADLETALATQVTELRRGVTADVEARLESALATSEAAKAGTQRIDRDIAGLKSDAARLEDRIGKVTASLDEVGASATRNTEQLTVLSAALDEVRGTMAKPADIETAVAGVTGRMTEIGTALAALEAAEAQRKANAARVVQGIELQNLKRALETGAPYAEELASVQSSGEQRAEFTVLEKFKDSGVATLADLRKQFSPAANAALDAVRAPDPEDSNVFDRLLAGAKTIVRVRRTDHAPDDTSPEAIIGRMEVAMQEGRLADVAALANTLPADARTAMQGLLDKVAARTEVNTAMATLEKDLKSALSASPESGAAPENATQ